LPEGLNLDLAFSCKSKREIAPKQSFSLEGQVYVLQTTIDLRFRTVDICAPETGAKRFLVSGREYNAIKAADLVPKVFKPAA
jgi:hypothetical protein